MTHIWRIISAQQLALFTALKITTIKNEIRNTETSIVQFIHI